MSERHRRLPRGQRKPRDPIATRRRNGNDQREILGLIGDLGDVVNAAGLSMHVSTKKDILTLAIQLINHCNAEHKSTEENADVDDDDDAPIVHRKRVRQHPVRADSSSASGVTSVSVQTTCMEYEELITDLRRQLTAVRRETAGFRQCIDDVNIAPPPTDAAHSLQLQYLFLLPPLQSLRLHTVVSARNRSLHHVRHIRAQTPSNSSKPSFNS